MTAYHMDVLRAGQLQPCLGWYARQGADGRWAPMAAAPGARVEFWAAWHSAAPQAVLGVCSAVSPCPQARALAGQFGARGVFLLPPALPGTGAAPLAFLLKNAARRAPQGMRVLAALPVKTGAALLGAYFDAGFVLCAMRGLFELRPHFIFLYAPGARCTPQVWVPAADTLALSRALAHGATGLALKRSGQGACVGLCAPFKNAQNSLFCIP